jgi:hypothetical protein
MPESRESMRHLTAQTTPDYCPTQSHGESPNSMS